ncbi:pyrroloquinoline quinone-dependent dehydrogenase [Myxococcota bacterium]|nr:pyrroloquinoline quinone-dependent dehydrogenase [Myxococcota bacterium]
MKPEETHESESAQRRPEPVHRRVSLTFLAVVGGVWLCCSLPLASPEPDRDWASYLGDPARSHGSNLSQIHRDNVHRLERVWTYHAGGQAHLSELQTNPLIVDGILYGLSPGSSVFALDASTGEEQWRFNPFAPDEEGQGRNRGLALWTRGGEARLFVGAGPWLIAIDPHTGRLAEDFGDSGRVDLRRGLDTAIEDAFVSITTPGALWRSLYIVGLRVSEGTGAAPGHVRAYDVRTGERRWIFHTIPHAGEPGTKTWPPEAWQSAGGANAWSGITLDTKRGMAFFATGSATPDFYGGDRVGDNLYANSVVALDANSGTLRWFRQLVHHDLWDRDLPAPPNLVQVLHEGKLVDAVAQVTKSGHVFVFDRDTGIPLFPVEERPVPNSEIPGEIAAPTQPFPSAPPPLTRQGFTREMVTRRTPEANRAVNRRLSTLRTGEPFIPPSLEGSVMFPGFDGGAEWGGAAWDAKRRRLLVNTNEVGAIVRLLKLDGPLDRRALYLDQCGLCHGQNLEGTSVGPPLAGVMKRLRPLEIYGVITQGRGRMPGFPKLEMPQIEAIFEFLANPNARPAAPTDVTHEAVRYVSAGYETFRDPDGYPANTPPWGTLASVDLDAGVIDWQVPLGGYAELAAQGIHGTGAENYGGPVVTAGGLVFIAATPDETLRAFDSHTGEILWQADLPFSGFATPATYQVGDRQFVVVAAGGGKLGRPSGSTYVAFALPETVLRPGNDQRAPNSP